MGSACSVCDGAAPPNPQRDTTLKVDMNQRLDAAQKRRKSIERRRLESTNKAKKISDHALEEKERLSMSVRSSKHRHPNGVLPIEKSEPDKNSTPKNTENAWEEKNGNAGSVTQSESKHSS